LIIATPLGAGRLLKVPKLMIAGTAPLLPDGKEMDAENEMDWPPLLTVTERVLPESEPVTV
jgi:predicted component of type VI protein secretion system